MEALQKEKEGCDAKIIEFEHTIENLNTDLENIREEKKQELGDHDSQLRQIQEQVETQEKSLQEAQEQLAKEKQNVIKEIEKQREFSKTIADMKQIENDLRDRISSLNNSLETSTNEKEKMATEKANIQVEFNTLREETEKKILELENTLKTKIEEVTNLEKNIKLHSTKENCLKETLDEKEGSCSFRGGTGSITKNNRRE